MRRLVNIVFSSFADFPPMVLKVFQVSNFEVHSVAGQDRGAEASGTSGNPFRAEEDCCCASGSGQHGGRMRKARVTRVYSLIIG